MAKVLYISYTGMLESLGQSQVLQYLFRLSTEHEITLVSFEKKEQLADRAESAKIETMINEHGIRWIPLTYHNRPKILGPVYDLSRMLLLAIRLQVSCSFDVVHCRSYIPALAGVLLNRLFGARFLFDMRGFWVDERIDGGFWKTNSWIYRLAKKCEKTFLMKADHIISLTYSGVEEIQKFPYMHERSLSYSVIPTCTNLEQFQPTNRAARDAGAPLRVGIVGSVGSWNLFDNMLECFKQIQAIDHRSTLLIVSHSNHDFIRDKLAQYALSESSISLVSVTYSEVVNQMSEIDVGLFFVKPVFSRKASAPTKLGEFLACGIPCITNSGVGDVERVLDANRTGVCVETFSAEAYKQAYLQICEIRQNLEHPRWCREAAEKNFSLEKGVEQLSRVYRDLAA